jgi:molybdenum cofactor cytidylyltransferase
VVAGIILAAGASSRMGQPKALLDFHGETFAGRLVRILRQACDPVIIALGYHADDIRPRIPRGVIAVVNPEPERGQLSSLQTALAALPADADGFMFMPVDCPAVKASTVSRIARVAAERDSSTLLVIPRCGDRRGHPVFAARAVAHELLALSPSGQARQVIHGHIAQTRYVDVDDPGILSDVDDPEAYRKLTENGG